MDFDDDYDVEAAAEYGDGGGYYDEDEAALAELQAEDDGLTSPAGPAQASLGAL